MEDEVQGQMSLTALPTEVLWRIATCGPAGNAIALIQTCHRLRYVMFDAILFKEIIKYQASNGVGLGLNIDDISSVIGGDTHAWARLAVADSEARALSWPYHKARNDTEFPQDQKELLRIMNLVGPCLVTLKHQPVLNAHSTALLLRPFVTEYCTSPHRLRSMSRRSYETAMELATPGLAFCLCATTLTYIDSYPGYHEGTFASRLIQVCVDQAQEGAYDRKSFESTFTIRFTLVALCSWVSLLSAHIGRLGTPGDPQTPKPSHIPWPTRARNGEIPLPYFDSYPEYPESAANSLDNFASWEQWYSDTVATMSEEAFLTEGEWCGYWSFESFAYGAPGVSFAESIRRMRITVPAGLAASTEEGAPMPIRSEYLDAMHDFMLHGFIRKNGAFALGPPGDSWVWRGRMTPFGLFGFWGSSDWTSIAGACWLWKRSWCQPPLTEDDLNQGELNEEDMDLDEDPTLNDPEWSSDEGVSHQTFEYQLHLGMDFI